MKEFTLYVFLGSLMINLLFGQYAVKWEIERRRVIRERRAYEEYKRTRQRMKIS